MRGAIQAQALRMRLGRAAGKATDGGAEGGIAQAGAPGQDGQGMPAGGVFAGDLGQHPRHRIDGGAAQPGGSEGGAKDAGGGDPGGGAALGAAAERGEQRGEAPLPPGHIGDGLH